MVKVYVSSTYIDLKECREQVRIALRKMGHEDVAMEYYVAEDKRPVKKCLEDVAACDLYVGIFAWRYGWIPKDDNPDKISITEMEYRQAEESGKHRLIFLLDEDAPWLPRFVDRGRRIKKLRAELGKNKMVACFKSASDIGSVVAPAIYQWAKAHGHISPGTLIPEFDLEKYCAAIEKRYQRLDLEGLTPPEKEDYLRLQLSLIFVEQSIRENPPPVELSKEAWEKLHREKEIHPEDLPAGMTLDDFRRAREVYYAKPARPVLDVLTGARHQNVIILGDPGSGKSTLARYVLLSLIDPAGDEKLRRAFDGCLPLLIELRSYVGLCKDGKCDTFLEFLEYLGKSEGWHLTKAALHDHLKNDGRAVVIFDGLDEIFDPEDRDRIARRIVGFANDYPKARIIATSRIIGYRRKILTDADFAHFTLQDLDESQVETFVNRWYELAMSDRPEEARDRRERIMRSFKDSDSIRQLAGNPMLLTIMAIIGKHQELPRERWKLYDHAANVLIEHWDVNKHLKDQRVQADFIGQDEKKEMLRRLAHKMQSGAGGLSGNYIPREELQAEFENYLKARFSQSPDRATIIARAIIDWFRERNFILSLYGANLYGFVHRAFLEYFCASSFVHKFEKTQELTIKELKQQAYIEHWEDRAWHEVLRLICGMIDEKFAGEIIDCLIKVSDQPRPEDYNRRPPTNIALAVQCLSEVKNYSTVAEAAGDLLKKVCSLFSNADVPGFDKFLLEQISTSAAMVGPEWPGRQILADWLREYKSFNSSFTYAEAFGDFVGSVGAGSEEIHKTILSYASHRDEELRFLSPFALARGWRDDPQTLPLLLDRAVSDSNEYVRRAAVSSLASQFRDDPQTLPLLLDRAENDPSDWVRNTAKGWLEFLSGENDA